ncbi:MAG: hypothetical protein JWL76_69 [Thermoleophilia bacterium]|nr:hypothetical protein [Thermoleophilia bacterium]
MPILTLLVVAFAVMSVAAGIGQAASSGTVVSAVVPSATNLDAATCAAGTAGVTDLGSVLPGSPASSTGDCVVTFGSSNDSSTLRVSQSDSLGTAMNAFSPAAMTSGTASVIGEMHAFDRQRAWIGMNGGEIRATTDGGQTWVGQTSGAAVNLRGIYAASAAQVWAVGYNGVIRVTANGGATWTGQTSTTTRELDDIVPTGAPGTLLVVGGDTSIPVVLRTTDSGGTWTNVTPGGWNDDITSADMASTTRGWIVGRGGFAARTDDGGLTWTSQKAAMAACTGTDLRGVAAISTTTVVAVGHLGRVCRSTDSGVTWALMTSGTVENLWDVERATDGTLWVVGRGAASPVLRSIDNGVTWTTVTTEAVNLEAVVAFDRDTAWWSGWTGLLRKIPSGSVPDYDDAGGIDWGGTSSMFGVCLSSITNASALWPTSANCPRVDGTTWRAIPATTSDPLSRLATTTTGEMGAVARLRFGFRPSLAQAPGRYVASVSFEVVAPST